MKVAKSKTKRVPKKFIVHSHDPTKAILPVSLHKPKDFVPDFKLFGVRRDLEIYGIIEGDAFDEMLDHAAA